MKKLKAYLIRRDQAIRALLNKPFRTFTREDFHLLRVEIKKLDALYELLDYCTEKFKGQRRFEPFDRIFQQAGKVRELQVEETVLKKYFLQEVPEDYIREIKNQIRREKKDFFRLIENTGTKSLQKINRKTASLLADLEKGRITRYLGKQRKKITALMDQAEIQPEQVHELRKRLKTYFYNHKSLGIPHPGKGLLRDDVITEWIGQWHDGQEIIRHLKHARKEMSLSAEEKNQLSRIIARITAANLRLYKKIQSTLSKRDSIGT